MASIEVAQMIPGPSLKVLNGRDQEQTTTVPGELHIRIVWNPGHLLCSARAFT
jgi:hypothetical protein